MNDLRAKIRENLAKLGKQHADLKIQGLPLKQKSIDDVISTPYLNFDFSKQRIDRQAFDWLLTIPDQLNLRNHFSMLLDGDFHNPSEKRKVSHTLYRAPEKKRGYEQKTKLWFFSTGYASLTRRYQYYFRFGGRPWSFYQLYTVDSGFNKVYPRAE